MTRVWVSYDEVKQKVRIRDVLEVLDVDLGQYTEGPDRSMTGPCPLPSHPIGDPKHRNVRQFRVDRKDGIDVFKCFATDCGAGGSVVQLAMKMLQRDAAHTRYFFADHFGDRLSGKPPGRQQVAAKKEPCEEARVDAEASAQGTHEATVSLPKEAADDKGPDELPPPMDHCLRLDPNVAYLRERGVSPATIATYGLGYASRGRMAGYVCLPVLGHPHPDSPYPLVYLGRYAGHDYDAKGKPKYKWGAAGFPKGKIIVGLQQAMEGIDDKPVVVTEGMFDMFAVVDAGYPHAVCIVGSDMTEAQAELLVGLKRSVVLMFDGDESGLAGARKAAGKLICGTNVRVVKLPEGKDPADLPCEQLQEHLRFML